MKVAFWSNIEGKNGVTSNLACISVMSALKYRLKSVILENHYNINNIENAFTSIQTNQFVREENYYFNHLGLDSLMKRLNSKIRDEQMIKKASIGFFNNNIFYIPHSQIKSKEVLEYELNQVIMPLLLQSEEFSNLVFIDTINSNNITSKVILDEADLVVVNLSQDSIIINHFFENYSSLLSKSVFIIGSYNHNSRYNLKNIQRKYRIKNENIAVIPYNIELKDALSEGNVIEFISRNYYCKKEDSNYYFIKELKHATDMIVNKIPMCCSEVLIC